MHFVRDFLIVSQDISDIFCVYFIIIIMNIIWAIFV